MTTDMTIGTLPPAAPEAEPAPGGVTPPPAAPADAEEQRRRRRLLILGLLSGLALILIAISTWYLLFRKPITQIIPPIASYTAPAYGYAFAGSSRPNGIAVSADGERIYVTQTTGDQSTLIFNAKGEQIGKLTPPPDLTARATQIYVAVDPASGDVYTTDRVAGEVYIYTRDGSFKSEFEPGTLISNFQPLGIGFGQNGHLYIADLGSPYQRIHEFDAKGQLLRDIGTEGTFDFPNGIAGDKAGYLYVTDSNHGRLLVFDPEGKQVAVVGRGNSAGELGLPRGLSIDADGRVYVVDTTAGAVEVFKTYQSDRKSLEYLGTFGVTGREDGRFAYPNGGAVDARGRVYVADWGNDRIQVWSY